MELRWSGAPPGNESARCGAGSTNQSGVARPGTRDAPLVGGRRTGASARPRSGISVGSRRQTVDVVERLAVPLVRPLRALVAQRGVEPNGVQRPFDVVGVVTLFEQREGHPPRSLAGRG